MHILLVAPSAPPKNSPEAMQVGRFIASLHPAVRVTLVTTTPVIAGWQWEDSSLVIDRPSMTVIALSLPCHHLTQPVLANRRLSFLHSPDSEFWLPWLARHVLRRLPAMPDVIYSRAAPFSASLLARRLKALTGLPWLMHLSDPWSDSPYRQFSPRKSVKDRAQEAACFAEADMITLTTIGQADHYRARYPTRSGSIFVTPNMMPAVHPIRMSAHAPGLLRLVYTGALYGERNPETLLTALRIFREAAPEEANRIRVDFYGNASSEMVERIRKAPGCFVHGPVSFAEVSQIQAEADLLVTIEPSGEAPLLLHFMPSKNLDYIAIGKPILAITPKGSETDRLCRAGYGWAFAPDNAAELAAGLAHLVFAHKAGKITNPVPHKNALPYDAHTVTSDITKKLLSLTSSHAKKGALA
ncbi:MAG: glycosyltransferase [Hyphomicrobiales bacterium]|nr:MAG: glycosyltransferase [Hyphomicrobiales bacterium]